LNGNGRPLCFLRRHIGPIQLNLSST